MRYTFILLWILFWSMPAAHAQLSIGIGFPGVSIGINLPVYPEFVRVPGYPVYYAPQLSSNFFFYDGMYWVFQGDNWYASSWYNGPWGMVYPEYVPLYVLRVPVRYYRQPPAYFRGWSRAAPPRWGQHWGNDWEQQRSGWNRWDRRAAPEPAPLPDYQRQYSGDRYPRQVEQQYDLQQQNYRYQPRDSVVRQHYEERATKSTPDRQESRATTEERGSRLQPQQTGTQRGQQPSDSSPGREDNPQAKAKEMSQESKRNQDQELDSGQDRAQGQNSKQKRNRE